MFTLEYDAANGKVAALFTTGVCNPKAYLELTPRDYEAPKVISTAKWAVRYARRER